MEMEPHTSRHYRQRDIGKSEKKSQILANVAYDFHIDYVIDNNYHCIEQIVFFSFVRLRGWYNTIHSILIRYLLYIIINMSIIFRL